jgi:hypothetical protein
MAANRKELIFAAAVLVGIPLLLEAGLRTSRTQFQPELYKPNRERGWVLRPGASGVVAVETRQYVRINSRGFRDEERSYDKPANTLRIAVLGNSWTEALQVPLDKTYTAVLQRELTKRACFASQRVEVLNFGVAGYSTAQELLTLQQEVWKYRPDVVLLAFYPARDIANNLRELNNASNPEQSPYFVERDGRLVLDDAFRAIPALQERQIALQNAGYQLKQHVRTLQAIYALQRDLRIRIATAAVKERAQRAGVDNLEFLIYAPPTREDMRRAWSVTEGLFLAMRDEVESHGAEFRIVVLATRPQVIPDAAKRQELTRKLGVSNLDYADERIREFGARENIAVITLAPALFAYAETQHVYLNGFNNNNFGAGHWNETGHRLAAQVMAAELCKNDETAGASSKRVSR